MLKHLPPPPKKNDAWLLNQKKHIKPRNTAPTSSKKNTFKKKKKLSALHWVEQNATEDTVTCSKSGLGDERKEKRLGDLWVQKKPQQWGGPIFVLY